MAKTKRHPGSIEKRGDSYRIRLCIGTNRHYFTLTTKDRRVAEVFAQKKEAELREESARQEAGLPGVLTCTQLLRLFEEIHLPKKAPNTQISYRGALKPLSYFFGKVLGDPPVSQIQPAHIEQYLKWRPYHGPNGSDRSRPLSNRTPQLDRAVLHRAFKLAHKQRYVDSNPVSPVDVPQPDERTPVILTDEQLEKLLSECESDDFLHLYVLTLAETGARCESEALWLRWKNVDLAEGFIWIDSNKEHRTKSREGRWVPMTKRLHSAMREHFAKYHFNQYGPHQSEWVFHHAVTRGTLSANVRETRSTQRIRVGRRQRKRTCWDCEREWKRMVVPLEPGRAKRSAAAPADPEVVDRPLRRRFSPSYKLRIVEEADRCTEPGEVGQLLRREGLYSSHLTTWRKAAHSGSLKALSKKRGRKPERNPLDEKVRKLERRNARLENELRKAHLIIDVQGKVAGLLGISLDDGTNS